MLPILRDINFTVDPGEFVAILGPSGSGNTIVMITHDLKVAQAAKRVVSIEDGCLTEMEG